MQLTIKTKSLAKALAAIKPAICGRTTLPILSNVLLEANGTSLRLVASNLDRWLSVTVEADVMKAGKLTVTAEKFHAIISRIASDTVELIGDEKNVLAIHGDSRKAKILGLPAEEFPQVPSIGKGETIRIDGSQLFHWLEILSPFQYSESDSNRMVLASTHLCCQSDKLVLHATTGRTLLKIVTELTCKKVECVIPKETTKLMMGAPSGELTLLISDSMIQVGDENWSLYARIFEGSYPNAEGVIPAKESLKHEFKVNRIALLDAVSYVQMMTSEKSSSVRITAKNSKLIISANTPDCGEADATIDCDGTADFVCHPEYMRHALKSLTEPEITINCDPMSLAMASANGITFIVMPMRIS